MAPLIYTGTTSLDGYIEDVYGSFEWAAPVEDIHAFINDLVRPIGTYLLGRRMYEVMSYWDDTPADQSPVEQDFTQIWMNSDKVVYSTTLHEATTARTRIEPSFDPEAVRRMKATAERPLNIGGPGLTAHALEAGLVDECQVFIRPVAVGGGKPFIPAGIRVDLELLDEHRFPDGTVYLHYAVKA